MAMMGRGQEDLPVEEAYIVRCKLEEGAAEVGRRPAAWGC